MCTGRDKHYYITGVLLVIKTLGATSELLNWFKQIKSVLCLFRIACLAILCISRYSEACNYEQFQINTKLVWPWWINDCLLLKIVFLRSHYSPWLDLDVGGWREELSPGANVSMGCFNSKVSHRPVSHGVCYACRVHRDLLNRTCMLMRSGGEFMGTFSLISPFLGIWVHQCVCLFF